MLAVASDDQTMPPQQWTDLFPTWAVVVGTLILLVAASELGFRIARVKRGEKNPDDEDRKSHVSVLLGALLALLGLLLAFSFSIVESRFGERKQLVLEEANAIGTTYLRAKMLPAPHGTQVQELLRQYVQMRNPRSASELQEALGRSEQVHYALWAEADQAAAKAPTPIVALFISSLNQVIDLHEARVTVGLYYRLPVVILGTLYLVSLLAMAVIGYSAGVSRTRPVLPTLAVITAVTLVMALIIELDRPGARLFRVNQHALMDVRETIQAK